MPLRAGEKEIEMIKKAIIGLVMLVAAGMAAKLVAVNMPAVKANMPLILVAAAIMAVMAAKAFETIPKFNLGIVFRIQKPTGRIVDEGLKLKVPFIDKIKSYSRKGRTMKINISVFSKDKREILMQGSVDWKIVKQRLLTFAEMENTIEEGFNGALKSNMRKIVGNRKGDVFVNETGAVGRIINCLIRLERLPHLHFDFDCHDGRFKMGNSFRRWLEKALTKMSEDECVEHFGFGKAELREKLKPEEWRLAATEDDEEELDLIAFYKKNAAKIELMLRLGQRVEEVSPLEMRYGISIIALELPVVDFSPETKTAMEAAQQKKEEMKSADEVINKKVEVMKKLKAAGITDPEQMSNAADVLIGAAEKRKVFSIEGGGAIPLLNLNEKKEG